MLSSRANVRFIVAVDRFTRLSESKDILARPELSMTKEDQSLRKSEAVAGREGNLS